MTVLDVTTAAKRLAAGEVIALPTETVYGLAADAGNAEAVAKVFALKGRPATNPLIVHVADAAAARRLSANWPEEANTLANAFWPGPLTIILPSAGGVAEAVTAGGTTVALRVPNHPMTLDVLYDFHARDGIGLAMPSANKSEHVSPTTADHVRAEFGNAVSVLEGGSCDVGIESTVISLAGDVPQVLRPGRVSVDQLEDAIGPLYLRGGNDVDRSMSPGRLPRHYAPNMPVRLVDDPDRLLRDYRWRGSFCCPHLTTPQGRHVLVALPCRRPRCAPARA